MQLQNGRHSSAVMNYLAQSLYFQAARPYRGRAVVAITRWLWQIEPWRVCGSAGAAC
jgi:hypothetical protein